MEKKPTSTFKRLVPVLVLFFFVFNLQSCIKGPSANRSVLPSKTTDQNSGNNSNGNGQGNGSTQPDEGDIDSGETGDTSKASVELRFFIDPFNGSAQTKLTLPKNFKGTLYIAGNNLTSLQDAFVDVVFKFGINSSVLTTKATIGKAKIGGIIPQTDTDVLVLNFTTPPFASFALPYDLYDYNSYATDETPVQDPRNTGLYCRGLRLEDDPTFSRNSATGCNLADDECLYAYAKVNDSNLYMPNASSVLVPIDPTIPQIDASSNGYATQSLTATRNTCLPDAGTEATVRTILGNDAASKNFSYGSNPTIGGITYSYRGPYYASSTNLWQIRDAAIIGSKGLFQGSLNAANNYDVDAGTRSMLFPLATKMNLRAGVQYYGSDNYYDLVRGITSLASAGESKWMDGCNARTISKAESNGESISSCNVTGTIELIVSRKNATDGTVTKETIGSTKNLKLQIIRKSETDSEGSEQIITSFNTCKSSNTCAADECCYNSRCWSKTLVYQCIEDVTGDMSGANGTACESDFECQSLCCDPSTRYCKEHSPDFSTPKYCEKPTGNTCVAKDWCGQEDVSVCKVYHTEDRYDDTGKLVPVCSVVCLPEKRFGDCIEGVCKSPEAPEPEKLEETNCSEAPSLK